MMKKRVALVVNTLSGGGAEKTVANLSRGLADHYDVDIIVNDKEHLEYPYKGHVISLKMPAGQGRMGAGYQIKLLFRRKRVLRYLKKTKKYAAVISFSEMSNVANVLSGNRCGKVIVSVRNSILRSKDSTLRHKLIAPFLMPWCYKTADITVSCSSGINEELEKHYNLPHGKGKVIYNGLELALIRKKAEEPLDLAEKEKMDGKKVIVSAGRLSHQKGHDHLLKVVKKLKEEGLPIRLIILGEGELRTSLEKMSVQLGITDVVSLPGFCNNPYKYMAHADAVVMPSLYEGFSNVILEALACGAPVISTDHETGAREILAPETDYRKRVTDRIDEAKYGILVPVWKEETYCHQVGYLSKEESLMAAAVRNILTNHDLACYYKKASLERANQLNLNLISDQWIKIIEE